MSKPKGLALMRLTPEDIQWVKDNYEQTELTAKQAAPLARQSTNDRQPSNCSESEGGGFQKTMTPSRAGPGQ